MGMRREERDREGMEQRGHPFGDGGCWCLIQMSSSNNAVFGLPLEKQPGDPARRQGFARLIPCRFNEPLLLEFETFLRVNGCCLLISN